MDERITKSDGTRWAVKFNAWVKWRQAVIKTHYYQCAQTDAVFERIVMFWDEGDVTGILGGRLIVDDRLGHKAGTTVTFNYLNVRPLTEIEVLAWASK